MWHRRWLLWCVPFVLSLSPDKAPAQTVEVTTIVADLRQAFAAAIDIEMEGRDSVFAQGWNLREEVNISEATFSVLSSKDYWVISVRDDGKALVDSRLVPQVSGFDYVLGRKGSLFCEWFNHEAKSVVVNERGESTGEALEKALGFGYLSGPSLIFGYLDGHRTWFLPDCLEGSTAKSVSGSDVVTLTTDGDYGTWRVDVNTTTHLPVQVAIDLDNGDYYGAMRLSDYEPAGDAAQLYPNRRISRVSRRITCSAQSVGQNAWAISGIESRQRIEYEGGVTFTLRSVVKVDRVTFKRPADDRFEFSAIQIPNNTPVQLTHARQLPYVWMDGQVVKDISGFPDASRLPFRQRGRLRVYLVIVGAALIALAVSTVLWRYRQHYR